MIGLALALVVVGVVFLFFVPWVGIPAGVGVVGVLLVVLYLLGVGRRATTGETPEPDAP